MVKSLYIASDHAGQALKKNICAALTKDDWHVFDLTKTNKPDDDYPPIAKKLAQQVVKHKGSFGIVLCGSGIGVCMAANKIKGARAATCRSEKDALLARKHNKANILCLGGKITPPAKGRAIVHAFLKASFIGDKASGKRHLRRVQQLNRML